MTDDEWAQRLTESAQAYAARRQQQATWRATLSARRTAGLRARHTAKLARTHDRPSEGAPMPTTTERRITCRYLRKDSNQCTGQVADELGEILLCVEHLGRAMELLQRKMPGGTRSARTPAERASMAADTPGKGVHSVGTPGLTTSEGSAP